MPKLKPVFFFIFKSHRDYESKMFGKVLPNEYNKKILKMNSKLK